jgi:surface polysaccharide O-acyltransferase-like enzyme
LESAIKAADLGRAAIINLIARSAVPYFFIISGYFWGRKIREENRIFEPTVAMMKRIAFLSLTSGFFRNTKSQENWFSDPLFRLQSKA